MPLRPGLPERQTHDYLRHGVTNLYAALDVASGQVIGSCVDRHRSQEYVDFLKLVNRNTPKGKVLLCWPKTRSEVVWNTWLTLRGGSRGAIR